VEIPDNIKGNLEIRPVKWIDEVLAIALTQQPIPQQPADAPPVTAAVVTVETDDKRARRNGRRVKQVVPPAH
jgi:ATP-dependent Lon protease